MKLYTLMKSYLWFQKSCQQDCWSLLQSSGPVTPKCINLIRNDFIINSLNLFNQHIMNIDWLLLRGLNISDFKKLAGCCRQVTCTRHSSKIQRTKGDKMRERGASQVVQWLRCSTSTIGGVGSIPDLMLGQRLSKK